MVHDLIFYSMRDFSLFSTGWIIGKIFRLDRFLCPATSCFLVMEKVILNLHDLSRLFCISDITVLSLDPTSPIEEKVPIEVDQPGQTRIQRIGQQLTELKPIAVGQDNVKRNLKSA